MNVCSYVQLVKYQIYECVFICTISQVSDI
nr:MAG TPA: hypothetical protein [Caudoviricetes sp.]